MPRVTRLSSRPDIPGGPPGDRRRHFAAIGRAAVDRSVPGPELPGSGGFARARATARPGCATSWGRRAARGPTPPDGGAPDEPDIPPPGPRQQRVISATDVGRPGDTGTL